MEPLAQKTLAKSHRNNYLRPWTLVNIPNVAGWVICKIDAKKTYQTNAQMSAPAVQSSAPSQREHQTSTSPSRPRGRSTFELQFQGDDGPVLGLFPVTVPVEGELHGRLHPLDLGGGCPVQLLHLGPAALAWPLQGRQRSAPGHPVHVLVGHHIALRLLSLQLLLLLCRGGGGGKWRLSVRASLRFIFQQAVSPTETLTKPISPMLLSKNRGVLPCGRISGNASFV